MPSWICGAGNCGYHTEPTNDCALIPLRGSGAPTTVAPMARARSGATYRRVGQLACVVEGSEQELSVLGARGSGVNPLQKTPLALRRASFPSRSRARTLHRVHFSKIPLQVPTEFFQRH